MIARAGSFDYPRAFAHWSFVQVPPLSLAQIRSAAARRAITFHDQRLESWETLDREELLPPIAYALNSFWHHDTDNLRSNGSLLVRDEVGYTEWDALRTRAAKRGANFTPIYSDWQVLTLRGGWYWASNPIRWKTTRARTSERCAMNGRSSLESPGRSPRSINSCRRLV